VIEGDRDSREAATMRQDGRSPWTRQQPPFPRWPRRHPRPRRWGRSLPAFPTSSGKWAPAVGDRARAAGAPRSGCEDHRRAL